MAGLGFLLSFFFFCPSTPNGAYGDLQRDSHTNGNSCRQLLVRFCRPGFLCSTCPNGSSLRSSELYLRLEWEYRHHLPHHRLPRHHRELIFPYWLCTTRVLF